MVSFGAVSSQPEAAPFFMMATFDGVEDAYSASGGRIDRSSARTASIS
jgi:hypothetical protein